MKYIALSMLRPTLDTAPEFACAEGFHIRRGVPGDEDNWVRIEVAAGEFRDEAAARTRLASNFHGGFNADMKDTVYFVETADGLAVGTATASSDTFEGEQRAQVSWVGMDPAYQGRGLSKPLLSAVMQRLVGTFPTAFLVTQTVSFPAIGLYLKFGFEPMLRRPECPEGWTIVANTLGHALPPPHRGAAFRSVGDL